jgi:arabinan endo-1,5-alpha-L-arabinosidase
MRTSNRLLETSGFGGLALVWCLTTCCLAIVPASAYADLTHRYSFKDDNAKDEIGKINGKLEGNAKIAKGALVLDNASKSSDDESLSYLSFDKRVLPEKGSATIEVWFTSKTEGAYARIFDFGERGEGYLFLTISDAGNDVARAAITHGDFGEEATVMTNNESDRGVNDGKPHMAAVVIDAEGGKLLLYVDGKEIGSRPLNENSLEKVTGANHWLGRSLFDSDAGFSGSIDELRIYNLALTADQIKAQHKAGADVVELPKATSRDTSTESSAK